MRLALWWLAMAITAWLAYGWYWFAQGVNAIGTRLGRLADRVEIEFLLARTETLLQRKARRGRHGR